MSTRAIIAKTGRDGSGKSIFLRFSGFPEPPGAGDTLLNHYQEEGQVDALLELGNIVILKETPEECENVIRDHGEDPEQNAAIEHPPGTDFRKHYWNRSPLIEWLYCWTPEGWFSAEARWRNPEEQEFRPLAQDIAEREETLRQEAEEEEEEELK